MGNAKDFVHKWHEEYADFVPTHLLTIEVPPKEEISLIEEITWTTGAKERILKGAFNNLNSNSEGLNVSVLDPDGNTMYKRVSVNNGFF
jgi:hypothetical protein